MGEEGVMYINQDMIRGLFKQISMSICPARSRV